MPSVQALSIALLCLSITSSAQGSLYVKYHSNGTASFADTLQPGFAVYKPANAHTAYPSKPAPLLLNRKQSASTLPAAKIELVAPSDKETIRSNQGHLLVVGELNNDDQLPSPVQLYIDGVAYGKPQQSLMFNIKNIDRGEHKVKMALMSEQGKIIALSKAITFYMHRNRVNRGN